ncbi:MAG: chemotaxis response regulator protein-glutamate methylesterase [Methylovulum sp.]|jgi:two-component system chemotaxis response regulator CheB|nr:chemotaxis response regulator protein-glutamate methylesterase [Methylovulum sp.]MCF7999215.1 chemotaxis response regulator protein-glutamate methylesterase [Methylovulum sp.]
MNKIRVLVIDDSVLVRKILTEILTSSPEIEVIGTAADPLIAREMIKQLNPDVLTLDIEMPHMDGITFLRNLMRLRPTPVVMISTLTKKGAEVTLEALALGAVDFIFKPKVDVIKTLNDYADEIIDKVKTAARANVRNIDYRPVKTKDNESIVSQPAKSLLSHKTASSAKIIAIGASTGGTEAIKVVAKYLTAETPPVFITQHLPAAFSDSFVKHIDLVTAMTALIPTHGQVVEDGHIYLAPGDKHMLVTKEAGRFYIHLSDAEPVNRHKPAVDVLFNSIAQCAGSNAIGILLTGMGADGAAGMKEMKNAGAITIIQDEQTSVVWGMPGAAYKLGCVDYVMPIEEVANKILSLSKLAR